MLFDATLSLERRPWTPGELRRALVRHPLMTAKVIGGIHWEAVRLWWKGVPVVPRKTRDGSGRSVRGRERAGEMNMLTRWARAAFLEGLGRATGGALNLVAPGRTQIFGSPGDLVGTLIVRDERFFARAVATGDIGIGEAYMDGDWDSPDLVALIRLMLRNLRIVEDGGGLVRSGHAHRQRDRAAASRQLAHPQSRAHSSALRPGQRLLPAVSRHEPRLLVRLLPLARRFARAGAGAEVRSDLPKARARGRRFGSSKSAAAGAASPSGWPLATAAT